jgi:hypothetical protein
LWKSIMMKFISILPHPTPQGYNLHRIYKTQFHLYKWQFVFPREQYYNMLRLKIYDHSNILKSMLENEWKYSNSEKIRKYCEKSLIPRKFIIQHLIFELASQLHVNLENTCAHGHIFYIQEFNWIPHLK